VVFAVLVAYNTEAESSSYIKSTVDEYPLTIGIYTANPEETIKFYKKLGFRSSEGLTKGLDVFSMEKEGTPYKLDILHNRYVSKEELSGGVSGMSFRVNDLSESVRELQTKGLQFVETDGQRDGVNYASLNDPNGISIKLFQP
jgi:catechol 2,3-dioxygenase-like lactoylglutathione lyase family enzyme